MERIHSHTCSRVTDAMKHRRRRRVVWGVVADATASLAARTRERVEKRDGRGINALRRAFVRSSEDDDDGYFLFLLFTPSSSSFRWTRDSRAHALHATLFLARFTQPSPSIGRTRAFLRVPHHRCFRVAIARIDAEHISSSSHPARTSSHTSSSSSSLCR